MNIIKNNPFRILGVYANATQKELIANQNKIKAFVKVGKQINFDSDMTSLLGDLERNSVEAIDNSLSKITLPKDKIRHALFWFIKETSIDEIALNHIKTNNIDKAVEILRKKTTGSSCVNLAMCFLLKKEYSNTIFAYARLLADDNFDNFVNAIVGTNCNISKEEVADIIIEELLSNFPKVDWLTCSLSSTLTIGGQLYGIGDNIMSSLFYKKIKSCYTLKFIDKLKDEISKVSKISQSDPVKCWEGLRRLSTYANNDLVRLKNMLGKDNIEYISIADQIASQMDRLNIGYYNNSTDVNKVKKLYPYVLSAYQVAVSDEVKKRCKEGVDFITPKYENLPPDEISDEIHIISKYCSSIDTLGNEHLLKIVESCSKELESIKMKVGLDNKYYINESSNVVNFALSIIIKRINEETDKYQNSSDINSEYKFKMALLWAKPIMDALKQYKKDSDCQERFDKNLSTFNSLYYRHIVEPDHFTRSNHSTTGNSHTYTSNVYSGRQTTNRREPTTSSKSNDSSDHVGCIIAAVAAVIGLLIIIMVSNSKSSTSTNNSNSSVADSDTICNIDTVAVDTTEYDYSYDTEPEAESYTPVYYNTGDRPYQSYYGRGRYDSDTENSLLIKNGSSTDAVVFLETTSGKKIRHVYICKDHNFKMTQIPAGSYIVKIIQGNSWNPDKYNGDNAPTGGFMENLSMSKSEDYDTFDYPDPSTGRYREGEITLYGVTNGNMSTESINESEMF